MTNMPEMPDEDSYSRVTNPERFLPLHDFTLKLVEKLKSSYDVKYEEGLASDNAPIHNITLARPSIRLTPQNENAAPLVFRFSTFPGVVIRFGLWEEKVFPACGCDACAETVERNLEDIEEHVKSVVNGNFKESIHKNSRSRDTSWIYTRKYSFKRSNGSSSSETKIDLKTAKELLGDRQALTYNWEAW